LNSDWEERFLKSFPTYLRKMKRYSQLISDELFVYVIGDDDSVLVYRPQASQQSCLYWVFPSEAGIEFISSANFGDFTFLTFGSSKFVRNMRINHNPTLTFYPGNYEGRFTKKDTFELKIQNVVNSIFQSVQQSVEIVNPQMGKTITL
jgi:hypothetical protein